MREILFKAKRLDNGEWIEGSLSAADKKWFIVYDNDFYEISDCCGKHLEADRYFEVVPETVGQFTGLTDKNGTKIFEGDRVSFPDIGEEGYEYKEGYDFTNYATAYFDNEKCAFTLKDFEDTNSAVIEEGLEEDTLSELLADCVVVGNIHDKEKQC